MTHKAKLMDSFFVMTFRPLDRRYSIRFPFPMNSVTKYISGWSTRPINWTKLGCRRDLEEKPTSVFKYTKYKDLKKKSNFYYSYLPNASTTNMPYNLSHYRDTAELSPCTVILCSKSTGDQPRDVIPGVGRR